MSDSRNLPPAGFISGQDNRNNRLSPHQAARIAQEQNGGGRVLAVDRNDSGYRVKLLKNGDVRIVYVPGS